MYENSIHLAIVARIEKESSGNPDQTPEQPFGVCVGVHRQFSIALKLAIEKAIKGVHD